MTPDDLKAAGWQPHAGQPMSNGDELLFTNIGTFWRSATTARYVASVEKLKSHLARQRIIGQSETSVLGPHNLVQRGADAAAVEKLVEESKTWRPK